MATPAPPQRGIDPEAEQEVDFVHYLRLLAVRWWLLVAGIVVGAVIGYLIALGGNQVYQATATIYLGQPYGPTGNNAVLTLQTNPGAVGAVIQSQGTDNAVASLCHAAASEFQNGISQQAASGGGSSSSSSSSKNSAPVTPLVKIQVQAKKAKVAACAANQLAKEAVKQLGTYPDAKITSFRAHIAFDNQDIKTIENAISGSAISPTDKLILETTLRADQLDKTTNSQLLLLATQVEKPRLLSAAAAHKVTAKSRRNTVVICALIGLILGAIAALLWDPVATRLTPRNGV